VIDSKQKIRNEFFTRDSKTVAIDLIGRYLVRRIDDEIYHLEIIETGAYAGISRKFGKEFSYSPGYIYIYSAQGRNKVLAISTMTENIPSVVTIRRAISVESLPEEKYRTMIDGPGKLTDVLKIGKEFDGFSIENENLWIEGNAVGASLVQHMKSSKEKMSKNCLGYFKLKI